MFAGKITRSVCRWLLAALACGLAACAGRAAVAPSPEAAPSPAPAFEKPPATPADRTEPTFWLNQGAQTAATEDMRRLAGELVPPGPRDVNGLKSIYTWMKTHLHATAAGGANIGAVTAADIYHSRQATGCHDWGLLFASLAREAGYPVRMLDTFSVDWLRRGGTSRVGHVFLEIYLDPVGWKLIDSTHGLFFPAYPGEAEFVTDGKIVYYVWRRGLDSWDMGITSKTALDARMDHMARMNSFPPPAELDQRWFHAREPLAPGLRRRVPAAAAAAAPSPAARP